MYPKNNEPIGGEIWMYSMGTLEQYVQDLFTIVLKLGDCIHRVDGSCFYM